MKNASQKNAPLLPESGTKCASDKGNSGISVQHLTPAETAKNTAIPADISRVLDSGLVPIPVAAEALGMDAKRLRGYVWAENDKAVREGKSAMETPIGCYATDEVYGWSLKELAKRQGAQA